MARPFVPYVPEDRSPNEPSIIASSTQVLGLYNQENEEKRSNVNDTVKSWYTKEMKEKYGWHEANFSGNQCLLEASVIVKKRDQK